MTDRELLELAAKAAQLNKPIWIDYECAISYMSDSLRPSVKFWNPLEDDGDALRLAVKLKLLVDVPSTSNRLQRIEVVAPHVLNSFYEPCGTDPYAATRRAIVRAAAEIGKEQA